MGSLCYASEMQLHDSLIHDEHQNQQKIFLKKLIADRMNTHSIYVPIDEQLEKQTSTSYTGILKPSKQEHKNQNFFFFWMNSYEKCEYILRSKPNISSMNYQSDQLSIMTLHEKELDQCIEFMKEKIRGIRNNQVSICSAIRFQIDSIILKDLDLLQSLSSIHISLKLYNQDDAYILSMNHDQSLSVNIKGETKRIQTNSSLKYEIWSPQNSQVIIHKNVEEESLNKLIQSIIITLNFKSANTNSITITIPISNQILRHLYPVRQLTKISNAQFSSQLSYSSKNRDSQNSMSFNQIGIICFRVQYISNDAVGDIKNIVNLCKARKNMIQSLSKGESVLKPENKIEIFEEESSFVSEDYQNSFN